MWDFWALVYWHFYWHLWLLWQFSLIPQQWPLWPFCLYFSFFNIALCSIFLTNFLTTFWPLKPHCDVFNIYVMIDTIDMIDVPHKGRTRVSWREHLWWGRRPLNQKQSFFGSVTSNSQWTVMSVSWFVEWSIWALFVGLSWLSRRAASCTSCSYRSTCYWLKQV